MFDVISISPVRVIFSLIPGIDNSCIPAGTVIVAGPTMMFASITAALREQKPVPSSQSPSPGFESGVSLIVVTEKDCAWPENRDISTIIATSVQFRKVRKMAFMTVRLVVMLKRRIDRSALPWNYEKTFTCSNCAEDDFISKYFSRVTKGKFNRY